MKEKDPEACGGPGARWGQRFKEGVTSRARFSEADAGGALTWPRGLVSDLDLGSGPVSSGDKTQETWVRRWGQHIEQDLVRREHRNVGTDLGSGEGS